MTEIAWDEVGQRYYETGVDHAVLYPHDGVEKGVPWNGLVDVTEKAAGGTHNPYYFDNFKYLDLVSAEEFSATLQAFTYPDEFEACDGSMAIAAGVMIGQQARRPFHLSYRTKVGNDLDGIDHAYKIHLIYNCLVSPSQKTFHTQNESPSPNLFSWDISTTQSEVFGALQTSHVVVDSRKVKPAGLAQLEASLYGTEDSDPTFPSLAEVLQIIEFIFVVDNGDGTYTVSGQGVTQPNGFTEFNAEHETSVIDNGDGTFVLTS